MSSVNLVPDQEHRSRGRGSAFSVLSPLQRDSALPTALTAAKTLREIALVVPRRWVAVTQKFTVGETTDHDGHKNIDGEHHVGILQRLHT